MPEIKPVRRPIDRRMIPEIEALGNPGAGWLSKFGGANTYYEMSSWPKERQLVLQAYDAGYTTAQDMADATGVRLTDVNRELATLANKGYVDLGVISK